MQNILTKITIENYIFNEKEGLMIVNTRTNGFDYLTGCYIPIDINCYFYLNYSNKAFLRIFGNYAYYNDLTQYGIDESIAGKEFLAIYTIKKKYNSYQKVYEDVYYLSAIISPEYMDNILGGY